MSTKAADLALTYQEKTDIEHILDAPDTYIGSIESDKVENWVLDSDDNMKHKEYDFIGGLYKCFDEGIVNCRDHVVRLMQKLLKKEKNIIPVRNIEITVDKETGVITMMNDGNGVDVAKHPDNDLWIPEMIFGHLRTSTNYDKNEKKIVGGKNGFGFKLVLIYSKWGEVETVDHIRGKKYIQRFENNLTDILKPKVSKSKSKPYTKVSWLPDYKRFGIDKLSDDIFNLFKKRTFDIGVVTDKSVRVKFNGKAVPNKSFEQYMDIYIGNKNQTDRVYECTHDRWEIGACLSPLDEFTQVSYVNGVNTSKGGKHIDNILNQIVKKMILYIEKKKRIKVKPATIKEQLMLFVNCVIENPSFDSQTKDCMNTPLSKWGSKCEISDKFIDKLAKMGVMDNAIASNQIKETKAAKKTDGKKTRNIRGIPKYMGANWAGGHKSEQCTLILCEGDSAKAGIVSGLSKEDRNKYGVFPLKGKLLNTLEANLNKINANEEITNIKKILGLTTGKTYTKQEAKKQLRYGKLLFMTDQDLDGAHIKGLCINMFHSQWHDLIKLPNFLGFMNTPILKATKGKRVKSFYTESAYQLWKEKNNNGKGWKVKYYKGLGTSTAKEFKEYFAEKKLVMFEYNGETSDNAIDRVFNKTRADDRKDWLANYDKDLVLDPENNKVRFEDFTDKEMIHFSKYDCERSIPNLIDGWKTSLRKVLFAAFKKNLVNEIKVAQFSGYVSEHSCYHHGEMSLNKGIIGMAHEFVGSNNINALLPLGQFGTRLKGGKDNASERYIFTALNPITRAIFPKADEPVLNYLDDDGTLVEPEYYAPIIPMILVNGGKGIGTGFSYEGLCYNPLQIIEYLKCKLKVKEFTGDIKPYYEGFKGEIIEYMDKAKDGLKYKKYLVKGKYEIVNYNTIKITELPIGSWTEPYKAFLESLMEDKDKKGKKKKPIVKSYIDSCTDTNVEYTVKLHMGVLPNLVSKKVDKNITKLEKIFGLTTTKSTSNMYLFDEQQKLKKYTDIYEIIEKYYPVRYKTYELRKAHMIEYLEKEVKVLSNKAKFIQEQIVEPPTLIMRKKKKTEVIAMLKEKGYDIIGDDEEYKYLRNMTIDSVEEENYEKLLKQKGEKEAELEKIKVTTIEQMWLGELKTLEKEYSRYKNDRIVRSKGVGAKIKKKKLKKKINKKNIKA
jgi:DNA topoisomerase-2